MNILPINNLRFTALTPANCETRRQNRFGLTMASPLLNDTVSFKGVSQTTKKMAKRSDAVSYKLAKTIRGQMEKPHNKMKQLFMEKFGDIMSSPDKKSLVTFLNRLKSENSICEKSATRGWITKDEIIAHMEDISGYCFILEDAKSFNEVITRLSQMLSNQEFTIIEAEYHRRAPVYKKNKIDKTYDSLKPTVLQKLKDVIIKVQHPTTQIWRDVDSMSGYSGLHLIIIDKFGQKHEIQIMISSIANVKKAENLLYKIRNGKTVDSKYRYIEKFLEPLKPKYLETLSEKEKAEYFALQSAMTKYTQEVYTDALKKPYDGSGKLLEVKNAESLTSKEKELIADYDFNTIKTLIDACEKIARK